MKNVFIISNGCGKGLVDVMFWRTVLIKHYHKVFLQKDRKACSAIMSMPRLIDIYDEIGK